MAMFRGSSLLELVALLKERGVVLYHACQMQDLNSYLLAGGIPSRGRLEFKRLPMTPFATDQIDRQNGVWMKVFLNLKDLGSGFADGGKPTPCCYGPIQLRLGPDVLSQALDVAICLRSAGTRGFDRERECLASVDEVDGIFCCRTGSQLKWARELRERYGRYAAAPEVSCTFPRSVIPYCNIRDAVVDPYTFGGRELGRFVLGAIPNSEAAFSVRKRKTRRAPELYDAIARLVRERTPPIHEFEQTAPESLRSWAAEIGRMGGLLERNYVRFADYLRVGTIRFVESGALTHPSGPMVPLESVTSGDAYDDGYYESELLSTECQRESALLREEADQDMEDWSRVHDEGWFYSDGDEDHSR